MLHVKNWSIYLKVEKHPEWVLYATSGGQMAVKKTFCAQPIQVENMSSLWSKPFRLYNIYLVQYT